MNVVRQRAAPRRGGRAGLLTVDPPRARGGRARTASPTASPSASSCTASASRRRRGRGWRGQRDERRRVAAGLGLLGEQAMIRATVVVFRRPDRTATTATRRSTATAAARRSIAAPGQQPVEPVLQQRLVDHPRSAPRLSARRPLGANPAPLLAPVAVEVDDAAVDVQRPARERARRDAAGPVAGLGPRQGGEVDGPGGVDGAVAAIVARSTLTRPSRGPRRRARRRARPARPGRPERGEPRATWTSAASSTLLVERPGRPRRRRRGPGRSGISRGLRCPVEQRPEAVDQGGRPTARRRPRVAVTGRVGPIIPRRNRYRAPAVSRRGRVRPAASAGSGAARPRRASPGGGSAPRHRVGERGGSVGPGGELLAGDGEPVGLVVRDAKRLSGSRSTRSRVPLRYRGPLLSSGRRAARGSGRGASRGAAGRRRWRRRRVAAGGVPTARGSSKGSSSSGSVGGMSREPQGRRRAGRGASRWPGEPGEHGGVVDARAREAPPQVDRGEVDLLEDPGDERAAPAPASSPPAARGRAQLRFLERGRRDRHGRGRARSSASSGASGSLVSAPPRFLARRRPPRRAAPRGPRRRRGEVAVGGPPPAAVELAPEPRDGERPRRVHRPAHRSAGAVSARSALMQPPWPASAPRACRRRPRPSRRAPFPAHRLAVAGEQQPAERRVAARVGARPPEDRLVARAGEGDVGEAQVLAALLDQVLALVRGPLRAVEADVEGASIAASARGTDRRRPRAPRRPHRNGR